jgi:hypothetical protein
VGVPWMLSLFRPAVTTQWCSTQPMAYRRIAPAETTAPGRLAAGVPAVAGDDPPLHILRP